MNNWKMMISRIVLIATFYCSMTSAGQNSFVNAEPWNDEDNTVYRLNSYGCTEATECTGPSFNDKYGGFYPLAVTPSGRFLYMNGDGQIMEFDTLTCENDLITTTGIVNQCVGLCALDENHLAWIQFFYGDLVVLDLNTSDWWVVDDPNVELQGDMVFYDGVLYCTIMGENMIAKIDLNTAYTQIQSIEFVTPEGQPNQRMFFGLSLFQSEGGNPLILLNADDGTTWVYDVEGNAMFPVCTEEGPIVHDAASSGNTVLKLPTGIYPILRQNESVRIEKNESSISLYFESTKPAHINIYDSSGFLVETAEVIAGNNIWSISTSSLKKGIYIIQAYNPDFTFTDKFIVLN